MNALAAPFVRLAGAAFLAICTLQMAAQEGEKGLTSDFGKLSAKERTRIADQENQAAMADSGYQDLMHTADLAFQQGRYQDALAAFQEARSLRPYNVYPKVKIQDLQALIRRKEAEKAQQAPDTLTEAPAPNHLNVAAPAVPAPKETAPQQAPPAIQQADLPPARPTPQASTAPAATRHAPPLPGPPSSNVKTSPLPGERIYKEAGAVVTERTVADEGRLTVYKKVVHPWGQTFHFKDGQAIPPREWKERFSE